MKSLLILFCALISSTGTFSQESIKIIFKDSETQGRISGKITDLDNNRIFFTNEYGEVEILQGNSLLNFEASSPNHNSLKSWFQRDKENISVICVSLDCIKSNEYPLKFEQQQKMELDGFVYDSLTGAPLRNALVTFSLSTEQVFTNKDGYFKIVSSNRVNNNTRNNKEYAQIRVGLVNYGTFLRESILVGRISSRMFFNLSSTNIVMKDFNGAADDSTGAMRLTELQHKNLKMEKGEVQKSKQYEKNASCGNPPASIRVKTGMELQGGCYVSGIVEVFSLETYVKNGIDNEWIPSWDIESLKAGTVAYRSYGVNYVDDPWSSSYDITSNHCTQVFVMGSTTNCITAANATQGELIEKNGIIPKTEYSSELNNLGCVFYGNNCPCSDGQVGDNFALGGPWGCVEDAICAGETQYGHARGICQYGTNSWATIQNKTYDWIIDHYVSNAGMARCVASTVPCNLTAPVTTMGQTTAPGSIKSIPPTFSWGGGNATLYRMSCAKFPFGPPNAIYNSSACETSTTVTPASSNFETGMLYRWVVRGTNDCNFTTCESANSNISYFYIKPDLSPSVTQEICSPILLSTPVRNVQSPGVIGYRWFKDGVQVNGAISNTFQATTPGTYKIAIDFSGGPIPSSTIYSSDLTLSTCTSASIIDETLINISIHPNPIAKDKPFYITNDSNYEIKAIRLIDFQGKLVQQFTNSQELILNKGIASQLLIFELELNNGVVIYKKASFI
jgi:Stage II sporulation protein